MSPTLLRPIAIFLALTPVGSLLFPTSGADWPQWRGPARTGISQEQNWRVEWPQDGPKSLWKASVGVGYGSVAIHQGKLYTLGNTDDTDAVLCLDAATGKELWKHTYPCPAKDPNGYHGTRCTPTVDGTRVYTLSRQGHFFCLDVATGKVIWSKDFTKDYAAKVPTWGFAGSPLIEGDLVITETGGPGASVIAFNKTNGQEVWKAGDDPAAYSSIVAFDHRGQRCLAVFSATGIVGRSARDGKELWRHPWKTSYDVNAATPIVHDTHVFISSGYNKGCALVDFASESPKVVWQSKVMRNHVGTCLLHEGHLYGFDEGQLKCIDFLTGEEKWADKTYGKGSLLRAGNHFILYSDRGRVATADLSPAGCKEIAGYQALGGKDTWAMPVLSHGRLYCRSLADLVCLDVAKP